MITITVALQENDKIQTLENCCASLLYSLRKHAPQWEDLMHSFSTQSPAYPQAKAAGKERWFCNVLSTAVEQHLAQHGLNVGGELSCSFTGPLPPYSEVRLRMKDVKLRDVTFKTAWHSSNETVATIPMLQIPARKSYTFELTDLCFTVADFGFACDTPEFSVEGRGRVEASGGSMALTIGLDFSEEENALVVTDMKVSGISAKTMRIATTDEPSGILERILFHGSLHMMSAFPSIVFRALGSRLDEAVTSQLMSAVHEANGWLRHMWPLLNAADDHADEGEGEGEGARASGVSQASGFVHVAEQTLAHAVAAAQQQQQQQSALLRSSLSPLKSVPPPPPTAPKRSLHVAGFDELAGSSAARGVAHLSSTCLPSAADIASMDAASMDAAVAAAAASVQETERVSEPGETARDVWEAQVVAEAEAATGGSAGGSPSNEGSDGEPPLKRRCLRDSLGQPGALERWKGEVRRVLGALMHRERAGLGGGSTHP